MTPREAFVALVPPEGWWPAADAAAAHAGVGSEASFEADVTESWRRGDLDVLWAQYPWPEYAAYKTRLGYIKAVRRRSR